MTDAFRDCPARTVYDALAGDAALPAAAYHDLIDALHPLWVEEVVCPVHVAVSHLHRAAAAAEAGDRAVATHHEAARTNLYQALARARLLTLEERWQEVVVDDLLHRAPPDEPAADSPDLRVAESWHAWRGGWGL